MATDSLSRLLAFEFLMQGVEVQKLIHVLIGKGIITQAEGVTFFTDLAEFCRSARMEQYDEHRHARARRYEEMAAKIAGGSLPDRDPNE